MKISVVTAVYDRALTVGDSLQSNLAQRYPDVERVVIDGGSTDGTVEVAKELRDEIRRLDRLVTDFLAFARPQNLDLKPVALAELVRQDPVAAEQDILDLSALYRSLLDHGSRPLAPLRDERQLVERFLAVEQMRLGSRLRVTWPSIVSSWCSFL